MSFATWYYPFFLTTIAVVFWLLPRGRLAFILLASFISYSFWDIRFCSLLIAAAASDYLCTSAIEDTPPSPAKVLAVGMLPAAWLLVIGQLKDVARIHVAASALACLAFCLVFISVSRLKGENRRRFFLYLAVGVNLGILAFFKYANWFSSGLLALLQRLGFSADWALLDVLLPLGISFHTFQSIAYAVDVFNRRCKAERDFWRVLCMIMFFPQLAAGPIERAAALLPQLRFERRFDWRFVAWALHLLLLGYFLKVFVADNCGVISDYFFKRIHLGASFGIGWALAATAASVGQIYGDFVGYSYIARGSAILLGIELTRNFELPLLARSPAEFWRRWHISLATWIRDYIFLPLWLWISYRNRSSSSGEPAVNDLVILSFCLIVTMLLFGLWHGADWHFIAFGGFHGVLQILWLVVPRAKVLSSSAGFFPRIASRIVRLVFGLLTFVLVCIAWILFRSDTLIDAARVLASAVGANALGTEIPSGMVKWLAVHAVPLVLLIALVSKEQEEADLVRRGRVTLAISYFLMIVLLASSGAGHEQFIYFQF